ncbi:hypothetical protein L3X38_037433 [Prunus dulcis]|uniref:Uncharacterized protein n=1 Tax=Prunus dulcis TaxID=3755 RepID=A0AAD4V4N1_PRUDU|nr:hypothetical protein L3X38_037433 [Prunus dulcis]
MGESLTEQCRMRFHPPLSMSYMRRCLERQDREIKERRCRRAEEKSVQHEEDEAVAIAVGLLEQSSQGRCVVHKSVVARMWTGIGILGVDKITRMGKSTTLERVVKFCDAIETLYSRDYLRKSTPRDLQRLL